MKKLLLTTALATSLLATAALADVKIGGGLEATIADSETGSSSPKMQGNAIGFEYELDITATGELSNGMKISTHAEFISDGGGSNANAPDDLGMTISLNGTTDLIIGRDQWEIVDQNVIPKAYNIIQDAANTTSKDPVGAGAFAANSNNIGIAHKALGGTFGFMVAPDVSKTTDTGDRSVGGGSGSAYEIGYNGSLGVDGLKVMVAKSSRKSTVDSYGDDDNTSYGIAYKMGKISAGIQVDDVDYSSTAAGAAATADIKGTTLGVTFAVSDAVTVGLQRLTTDIAGAAKDEVTDQIEVAYNLGAATLAASMQTTDNPSGSASNASLDSYTITLKQSW